MLPRLLDFIFPPHCLSCGAPLPSAHTALCIPCFSGIALEKTLRCGECFARIPQKRRICHKNALYTLGAAAGYQDEKIRALVQGLKFRHAHAAAETLGALLSKYLESLPMQFSLFTIIPVPLAPARERKRGYNQSVLLAKAIQRRTAIPILQNVLIRRKNSDPQSKLEKWDARRENVRGAFAVANLELLPKSNIILLDDVTTSGATFFEAATALREAGARRIFALAAAKA